MVTVGWQHAILLVIDTSLVFCWF